MLFTNSQLGINYEHSSQPLESEQVPIDKQHPQFNILRQVFQSTLAKLNAKSALNLHYSNIKK